MKRKEFALLPLGAIICLATLGLFVHPQLARGVSDCQAKITFDVQPHSGPFNQNFSFTGSFEILGPFDNSGYCTKNGDEMKAAGPQFFVPVGQVINNEPQAISLQPGDTSWHQFSMTLKPSDYGKNPGDTLDTYAYVLGGADVQHASNDYGAPTLINSSHITITLTQGVYSTYACVADNGNYSCSPNGASTCPNDYTAPDGSKPCPDWNTSCSGKQIIQIPDSNQCSKAAPVTPIAPVPAHTPTPPGTSPIQPSSPQPTSQSIGGLTNPLTGCNDLSCVGQKIISFLQTIAYIILSIMVLWGGFQMMTAGGSEEKFATGRKTLTYAVIGIALVIVASGVAGIIRSLLGG